MAQKITEHYIDTIQNMIDAMYMQQECIGLHSLCISDLFIPTTINGINNLKYSDIIRVKNVIKIRLAYLDGLKQNELLNEKKTEEHEVLNKLLTIYRYFIKDKKKDFIAGSIKCIFRDDIFSDDELKKYKSILKN
jgi:hypothetical protein